MKAANAYAASGVNLGRAYRILDLISSQNSKAISHFATTVEVPRKFQGLRLAFSADGVGTKIELLTALDINWISGWDCVAMNSNDLLCQGAKPLWFLDYYSQNKLNSHQFEEVLKGIRKALAILEAELAGGETAELPGMLAKNDTYELAGFLTGVQDPRWKLSPERVRPGDVILGLESSGPHSNGFSLIRSCLKKDEISKNAATLLAPTRLYHPTLWPLLEHLEMIDSIHAMAHITGGAFMEKLPRALNPHCQAVLDIKNWVVPPIFSYLQKRAGINCKEACGVWNMGIGFALIVSEKAWPKLSQYFKEKVFLIGHVDKRPKGKEAVKIIF